VVAASPASSSTGFALMAGVRRFGLRTRASSRSIELSPTNARSAVSAYDPQELLTPDEVCALLKMKRTWFYAQVAHGSIKPIKLGRSTRVRRRDLEAYLSRLEQAS
jgi:excisionase family DNA binding protein